jgi:hypothetical protein
MFGFQRNDMLEHLDFDHAKQFLKDRSTEAEWEKARAKKTPKEFMIEYMEFAWDKANEKRGLSAMRSMEHYRAWLWLDGDDVIWPELRAYTFYGKPHLIRICHYLSIDPTQFDDGIRENE